MKYLDSDSARRIALTKYQSIAPRKNLASLERDREFNLDTYKELFLNYCGAKEDVRFSDVRAQFYKDKLQPYFDGKNYYIDWHLAQRHYVELVSTLVSGHMKEPSAIVDLGAGSGEIVRYLSHRIKKQIIAADKSSYALDLIKLINKREGFDIHTVKIDFADSLFYIPENAFVLTTYSLMYLQKNPRQFFINLLESGPQGGLFIEPIFTDQSGSDLFSELSRDYFLKCGYSIDFYIIFKEVCSDLGYTINFHLKNVLAHNLLIPVSAIGWERAEK
jgi:hypothetical protein